MGTSVNVPSEGSGGATPSAITQHPLDFLLTKKVALPSLSPQAKLYAEMFLAF